MSKPKLSPADDIARRTRRKAARQRAKQRLAAEDFMDDQLERFKKRLADMDSRLHKVYIQAGMDAIEASRPLGMSGPRRPDLSWYDEHQD